MISETKITAYCDFETYWDTKSKYSLTKISRVEYVRDPKFKVFGLGFAIEGNPINWTSGKDIPAFMRQVDLEVGWVNIELVAHNIKFDSFVLQEKYGISPGRFIDTKGMSRAVLGKSIKDHRLATLAEYFNLQEKGTMKTDGLLELTQEQENELAEYCKHDVWLCREIFRELKHDFPNGQYEVMHRTIDMFVNPKLVLDVPLLEEANEKEKSRREDIFFEIGIDKKEFASNKKFPELLRAKGYDVPTKISASTGKPIPALALGDIEFIELMEEGNEELKSLCKARVAAKSTLLETRTAKLAKIGATGKWPFDVEYSGADQTHRFSGGSGAGGNPQNFTRDSALRGAVRVPKGQILVVGDFDKVECRFVAYLSRDKNLIAAIEGDAYSAFAANYYGRKITKADIAERRFGKEAILGLGYGMGWRKFKDRVKLKTGKEISEDDAKKAVNLYRQMYPGVPALWERLGIMIPDIARGQDTPMNTLPVYIVHNALRLPSGLEMLYPNLRTEKDDYGKDEWVYDTYKKGKLVKSRLYGGKLLENISQALAGELCKEAMMKFGNKVTGLVHDEIHVITSAPLAQIMKRKLHRAMTTAPTWLPDMKLKAEVEIGKSWLEAK